MNCSDEDLPMFARPENTFPFLLSTRKLKLVASSKSTTESQLLTIANHLRVSDDIVEHRQHFNNLVMPAAMRLKSKLESLWDVLLEEVRVDSVNDLNELGESSCYTVEVSTIDRSFNLMLRQVL